MTLSIVAYDPRTRTMGAAIASFGFAVGPLALWARPGAGIVITQMMPEPNYGAVGLERMGAGEAASSVLASLLATDAGAGLRQLAMLDTRGTVASHTGAQCVAYAGHRTGRGISVQGAMLLNDGVWEAMVDAFDTAEGSLAERLLVALEMGRSLGGDIRGQRAAALVVVHGEASSQPWRDRLVDLRIDDHPDPIRELRRLYELGQLYSNSNNAFEVGLGGEMARALDEFAQLEREAPDDADVALRHAILLALSGNVVAARRRLGACYRVAEAWRELARRLALVGFLPDDPRLL